MLGSDLMKKSPLIRAGACTLGLSARCLASRSAGAALALVRPSVPNLVVTLCQGAVFGHLLSKIIKVPLISESVHVFPPYGKSSVF